MEGLPADLCLKLFCLLDHQSLASAQQVCRKWKALASDNTLWSKLFEERWGRNRAEFFAPVGSKSWKDIYEVQDRCDRVGLGLKIIREGGDYYLVHQGEIQRFLGSRRHRQVANTSTLSSKARAGSEEEDSGRGVLDKILFFVGDLEMASEHVKRNRLP